MKTQQEAEKKEQQRIKDLVLNYDLRESEEQDGNGTCFSSFEDTNSHYDLVGNERAQFHHHNRPENRVGKDRGGQRVRKLQLSDVDWYERPIRMC